MIDADHNRPGRRHASAQARTRAVLERRPVGSGVPRARLYPRVSVAANARLRVARITSAGEVLEAAAPGDDVAPKKKKKKKRKKKRKDASAEAGTPEAEQTNSKLPAEE